MNNESRRERREREGGRGQFFSHHFPKIASLPAAAPPLSQPLASPSLPLPPLPFPPACSSRPETWSVSQVLRARTWSGTRVRAFVSSFHQACSSRPATRLARDCRSGQGSMYANRGGSGDLMFGAQHLSTRSCRLVISAFLFAASSSMAFRNSALLFKSSCEAFGQ
jgi:hypothetical protein